MTDNNDRVDSPRIAAFGVLSALGVFIAVMALQVVFFWQDGADRSGKRSSATEYRRLAAEHEGRLNHYAWVHKESNTVRIPIARAMSVVVAERQAADKDH